jgi:hypothetical protein
MPTRAPIRHEQIGALLEADRQLAATLLDLARVVLRRPRETTPRSFNPSQRIGRVEDGTRASIAIPPHAAIYSAVPANPLRIPHRSTQM